MSIARKALVGAIWTSGANYLSQAVGFVALAALGRLLLEADFGLFATANSMVQFVFILSAFSFNLSIIQCQEEREHLYSTAFVLVVALSGLSLFFTGAGIAVYSHFRTLSVTEITVIGSLSLVNVLNLFGQHFDAILQRDLAFKKTSTIAFLMNIANPAVAMAAAASGLGVWSLVCGQAASSLVFLGGSWRFSRWKIGVAFSRDTAVWLLRLGWRFLGSRSLEVVYTEMDRLVIKSMNNYEQVGIYDRAVMAARYPARAVTPAIINVALPVYSRLKTDDARLSDAYALVNYFLVRVLIPLGLIFFLLPDTFMAGVLGEKWVSAAPVLRILALYAVMHPMVENFRVLFYALGKPEEVAKVRVLQIVVYLPLLWMLTRGMGITGTAWALLASIAATYAFFLVRSFRHVRLPMIATIVLPIVHTGLTIVAYRLLPLPSIPGRLAMLAVHSIVITAIFVFFVGVLEGRTMVRHFRFFRSTLRDASTTSEHEHAR
jgi:O-antigen/teichoic acid export membrane protein